MWRGVPCTSFNNQQVILHCFLVFVACVVILWEDAIDICVVNLYRRQKVFQINKPEKQVLVFNGVQLRFVVGLNCQNRKKCPADHNMHPLAPYRRPCLKLNGKNWYDVCSDLRMHTLFICLYMLKVVSVFTFTWWYLDFQVICPKENSVRWKPKK